MVLADTARGLEYLHREFLSIFSYPSKTSSEIFQARLGRVFTDVFKFIGAFGDYQIYPSFSDIYRFYPFTSERPGKKYYMPLDVDIISAERYIQNEFVSSRITPQNYSRRTCYTRRGESVVILSHHKSLHDLIETKEMTPTNFVSATAVVSTTNFGLEKTILKPNEVEIMFGEEARQRKMSPSDVAIENDYMCLTDSGRIRLHPKHPIEAALKRLERPLH